MKFKVTLICAILLLLNIQINAEETIYHLVNASNGNYEKVEDYTSFNSASYSFRNLKDDYSNLVLLENDKVILMEYGIVEFKVNQGCTLNIDYKDANTNEDKSINGCYGIDAAYIESSRSGQNVYFKISGSNGVTDLDNVILHPYDTLDMRISSYTVINGQLHHEIKTQLLSDFYSTSIIINDAPAYLKEGESYFSYDGHYFYDDFYKMIDDLNNEVYDNAINPLEPYYNYYAYIPHRSLSNYSYEEINNYIENGLCFDKKLDSYYDSNGDNANDVVNRSQYVGELASFIENQYLYGANALMMLSLSINESSFGKSAMAFGRNNLFGHAAFDSDVERNASRYLNIATSVYSHAKYYIGDRYSNPNRTTYYGSYFGDKQSGMNVMYSSDPYWGEKAAFYYRQLDKSLGNKDLNTYALGISNDFKDINIYDDQEFSNHKLTISDISPYSMIILDKFEGGYKVQLDPSFSDDNRYVFNKSVGYVKDDSFNLILNEDKIYDKKYHEISYDLNGGMINHQDKLTFLVKDGQIPNITNPKKDGYEFTNYDHEVTPANKNDVYVANYKKIKSIELISLPPIIIEYDSRIDLTNGKLKVIYEDDTEKIVDLDTNMVNSYDLKKEGLQDVTINYNGLTTTYKINVSKKLSDNRSSLKERLDVIIDNYKNNGTYNENEVLDVTKKLKGIRYNLNDEQIKILDKILLEIYKDDVNFYIEDSRFDVNISGMALALDAEESLNNKHFLYKDTYLLQTTIFSGSNYNRLKNIGTVYGFDVADSFTIMFKRNSVKLETKLPIIVQLKIEDIKEDKLYTVYRIDEDGDVEKCKTTRTSDYIEFTTSKDGSFMVLAMDSQNVYDIENDTENLNHETDGIDLNRWYFKILRFTITLIITAILALYHYIKKGELNKRWNDYKKSLRSAELLQEEKLKN